MGAVGQAGGACGRAGGAWAGGDGGGVDGGAGGGGAKVDRSRLLARGGANLRCVRKVNSGVKRRLEVCGQELGTVEDGT